MGKSSYYVDTKDYSAIQELIDRFDVQGTDYDRAIRAALSLHDRPFILYVDLLNQAQISPLDDPFTFNIETDELVLFTDDPAALIDAILEMAMFLRGFNTMLGIDDDWKIQVAIGAWRRVREQLKADLQVGPPAGKRWSATLELDIIAQYNIISFAAMVYLAGRHDLEVMFPEGTSALVITAYERLSRIMDTVALDVGVSDHLTFNRRLSRALLWIEESILPSDNSPFDDLFGPEGFSDRFFDDGPDDPM
jgi:hypothetical protein